MSVVLKGNELQPCQRNPLRSQAGIGAERRTRHTQNHHQPETKDRRQPPLSVAAWLSNLASFADPDLDVVPDVRESESADGFP
jgi:hypothetical protein